MTAAPKSASVVPNSFLEELRSRHRSEDLRIFACLILASDRGEPYAVREDGRKLRLVDISRQTGITAPNVHNKLGRLVQEGWLRRDTEGHISINWSPNECHS